ncbi:MAG: hypothetical protein FXF54_13320 [Kosmotoga sp.]|nr:MAG: hypothetical protein FXF54_13320 [Kosmotoga sp.]
MSIEKMHRVFFGFSRNEFEKNLAKLINSGSLEPIELANLLEDKEEMQLKSINENPYGNVYKQMQQFLQITDYEPVLDRSELEEYKAIDTKQIEKTFSRMNERANKIFEQTNRLKKKLSEYNNILFHMRILSSLDIELGNISDLERIRLIFGKLPEERYNTLIESVTKSPILFLEVKKEKKFSWILVLTPPDYLKETYDILHSAYFEEDSIPLNYKGTPKEIQRKMEAAIQHTRLSIRENETEIQKMLYASKEFIDANYPHILLRKRIYDLSNYGVFSSDSNVLFMSGWVPENSIKNIKSVLNPQILKIEEAEKIEQSEKINAPTKLSNKNRFIKGFEVITNMFGAPKYEEIDPTPLVAIIFTFMFGLMLGDIGHGMIIFLVGLLFCRKWENFSQVLMSTAVSSIIFGILYGSFFGFEVFSPLWLRPTIEIEQLMSFSIYFGIAVILCGFLLNIINGFMRRDWEKAIFGEKGIVGALLYVFLVYTVIMYLRNGKIPVPMNLFISILIILSITIIISEPLNKIIKRQKPEITGEFWITSGVRFMNTLLEFLSNTISFVRLAAFALTHGALFNAFWTLTLMVKPTPGGGLWAALIFLLGQFILIGLESLVVFIQDLRLTYYEYFTKFFDGTGRLYKPFVIDEN